MHCIYYFGYMSVKIYLLALANEGALTILLAIEEMDFLIYYFVFNTQHNYFAGVLHLH